MVTIPVVVLYAMAIGPMAWNGPVGPYLRMALPILDRHRSSPGIPATVPATQARTRDGSSEKSCATETRSSSA